MTLKQNLQFSLLVSLRPTSSEGPAMETKEVLKG